MKKWKCGSDRIMRVKTKNCCCVGDSDPSICTDWVEQEWSEGGFYEQLQETVKEVQKQEKLMGIGDLNA